MKGLWGGCSCFKIRALVASVVPGGPAASAGIKQGDVIVNFDGKEIKDTSALSFRVSETPVGNTVPVIVIRNSKELTLRVMIAEMPAVIPSAASAQQRLGITAGNITPQLRMEFSLRASTGVVVVSVDSGSPADDAGIQAGDVIKEVNRITVKNMKDYENALSKTEKGKPMLFLINRNGQSLYVSIKIS